MLAKRTVSGDAWIFNATSTRSGKRVATEENRRFATTANDARVEVRRFRACNGRANSIGVTNPRSSADAVPFPFR
eukprot:6946145-Pyramimonas_sp.AAC.1